MSEQLARQRAHEIVRLNDRWDDFYSIGWDWQREQYQAVRRDTYEPLYAPTPTELSAKLEVDLSERPIKVTQLPSE